MPGCRHPDIQKFDSLRCCLSCGEALFDNTGELEDDHNASQSTGYRYRRLSYELGQEIRLLVLYPGQGLEELACEITHVNLLDDPVYEAVSYTWATVDGDASLSGCISCRGRRIPITSNCESVLRSLRRIGLNRRLWIDAICIDQNNILERNHQVRLMAVIYSNASQVLAYVSPFTNEHTNRVMEYLDGSSDELRNRSDAQRHLDVAKFLRMPYFDRVWVLQEIALAKIVSLIIGTRTLRWTADTVSTLLELCVTLNIYPPSVLRWLPASQPESQDLLDVLQRSRNCSATDMRDKAYALLGLVSREIAKSITVDYSRTPDAVYSDIAIYLLETQGRVDVITHALNEEKDTAFIPTWVPQWHVKSAFEPLPTQFTSSQVEILATSWFLGKFPITIRSSYDEKRQREQQAAYASTRFRLEICNRSPLSPGSDEPMATPSMKRRTHHPNIERRAIHMTEREQNPLLILGRIPPNKPPPCLKIKSHFLDIIRKLLPMLGKERDLILPHVTPEAFCNRHVCSECFGTADPTLTWLPDKIHEGAAQPEKIERDQKSAFKSTAKRLGNGKTPFLTHLSMGFAQEWRSGESIWVNDTIWALAGLQVPVILRKVGDHYILIGECYLFRAALPFLCMYCGAEARQWPMVTEVIEIW